MGIMLGERFRYVHKDSRVMLETEGAGIHNDISLDEVVATSPIIVAGSKWHLGLRGPVGNDRYGALRDPPPLKNIPEAFRDCYHPGTAPSDRTLNLVCDHR
jgi:hypothetical protein